MKENKVKNIIYIGIDPGANGGVAVIHNNTAEAYVLSEDLLLEMLSDLSQKAVRNKYKIKCILEKVGARPKQGVVSTFNFGCNFGFIQGVLKAYKIEYKLITPQKWKKEMGVTSDKDTSIREAKRLFPDVDLRATKRCKNDHDGKAEALLLAEYGRREE